MVILDNYYYVAGVDSGNSIYTTYYGGFNPTYSDTHALGATRYFLEHGDDSTGSVWFTTSSSTIHSKIYATGMASLQMSTTYSYTSSSGNPTTKPAISDSAAQAIEGRGSGIADIIRLDGTRTGTYTTGGTINDVDISDNGLWAVAGSNDGIIYLFSKASSSSWTLTYVSDTTSQVKSVAISSDGLRFYAGRADGTVTAYRVAEAGTSAHYTFYVIKEGTPYINQPVTVYDLGTAGADYDYTGSGDTDSLGSYSLPLSYEHYYEVSVNSGEKNLTILASSNLLTYYMVIPSSMPSAVNFAATYNATAQEIYLYFLNSSTTDSATWTITRLDDHNTQVVSYTCTSAILPTAMPWSVPGEWRNVSYKVTATVSSGGHVATNTWLIFAVNDSTMEGGAGNLLPSSLDGGIKMGIGIILILCIGGVFSYLSGPLGALIVSISAMGLVFLHVFPVNMWATITLCIVWSFLGLMGKSSPEV